MSPVKYEVKALPQNTSECMQTAAAQMLSYFDPSIQLSEVIEHVPLYIDDQKEKIGTSPGHLAAYLVQKGYHTMATIFDTELFDRSWGGLATAQVVKNLKKRQQYIPSNSWLSKYHHILVDGWELYAQNGGLFNFPDLTASLLHTLIDGGPYLLMLNSTYLNHTAKQSYHAGTDRFSDDPFRGRSLTHATTCAGYKDGMFLIVDPDPPPHIDAHRWIPQDHLIASIMAAQTESDNLLVSIRKK